MRGCKTVTVTTVVAVKAELTEGWLAGWLFLVASVSYFLLYLLLAAIAMPCLLLLKLSRRNAENKVRG